jgi:hypothetical protein
MHGSFDKHRPHSSIAVGLLWIFLGAATLGCSSGEPFDYVPVSGKVMYEDGSAIPTAHFQLVFESQSAPVGTAYPRPAKADVSNGAFSEATSHKFGDGLVPGKHKVIFAYATDASGKSLVPKEYISMATTPLVINTADAPLVIKVPKP